MSQNLQNGMPCAEFEALLTEAVEGQLSGPDSGLKMQAFSSHSETCERCRPLFAEALAGYQFLQGLAEAEPPAHLLHNILAATSEAERTAKQSAPSAWQQLRNRLAPLVAPVYVQLMQPRIAGSIAMAFFSIALLLNITGVHVANVKQLDLRPQAIQTSVKRSYFETSARMVKYYDSLRFVYEVESRLRELKQNVAPEEQKTRPSEKREKREKNNKDMSNRPEQENQNYSQQMPGSLLEASLQPPLDSAIQPSLGCESRLRRTV